MTTYLVTGTRAVHGVAPGGTVELDDSDAERLIAGGHVTANEPTNPVGDPDQQVDTNQGDNDE